MHRRVFAVFILIVASCAGLQRPGTEHARHDHPLEEIWPRVHQLLEKEGYLIRAQVDDSALVTEWRQHFAGSAIASVWTRVIVIGRRLGDRRSELRIFRHQAYAADVIASADAYQSDPAVSSVDAMSDFGTWRMGAAPGTLEMGELNSPHGRRWSTFRDLGLEGRLARALGSEVVARAEPQNTGQGAEQALAPGAAQEGAKEFEEALCGSRIAGLEELIAPGKVLLLGEIPGTAEAPRFVGTAACAAAVRGYPVSLLLELPEAEQPRVEAFFDGDGSPQAEQALLEGRFWRRAYQDGRSSRAMLELLKTARSLRALGLPVRLRLIDEPGTVNPARSLVMGQRVAAQRSSRPDDLIIALTGNVHVYALETPEPQTLAAWLERQGLDFTALEMSHLGGQAWTCVDGERLRCGRSNLTVTRQDARRWHWAVPPTSSHNFHVRTFGRRMGGIDGTWFITTATASPPAVGE